MLVKTEENGGEEVCSLFHTKELEVNQLLHEQRTG